MRLGGLVVGMARTIAELMKNQFLRHISMELIGRRLGYWGVISELGRTIRSVGNGRDKRKKDLVHFHISCLAFGSLGFGVMITVVLLGVLGYHPFMHVLVFS
jgi:hypothetical protein